MLKATETVTILHDPKHKNESPSPDKFLSEREHGQCAPCKLNVKFLRKS